MSKPNDLPIWIGAICLFMGIFVLAVYFNPSSVRAREAQQKYESAMELASEMQLMIDQFACVNGGECRAPAAR